MELSYGELRSWVNSCSAIRRVQRLQPAGGRGDTIFPSTYPGEGEKAPPVHAFEIRRIGEQDVHCVIIDSVQSQANRLERALITAARAGLIHLPYLEVDFTSAGIEDIGEAGGRISSLEAPHRIYDAIFRDSESEQHIPFMATALGSSLASARPHDATAVLQVSPNALLFGAWHSQAFKGESGSTGGAQARFARCLVSEITGINTPVEDRLDPRTGTITERRTAGRRTSSRIDPLGITKGVPIFKGTSTWSDREEEAGPDAKRSRPSEVNHGAITPSIQALGVTMDYAEQIIVLTLAGLRRLTFGADAAKSVAARAYLAALGLLACAEQDLCGYALRSRCDLVPEGGIAPYEVIAVDGACTRIELRLTDARALYETALTAVREAGFELPLTPTRLLPQRKLVATIQRCRAGALEAEAGTAGDA